MRGTRGTRPDRMRVATVLVLVLATVSVFVYAVASRGNPARKARLNDSGVWVSTDRNGADAQQAMIGQMNVPASQFAVTLNPPDADTNLDVLQTGAAALSYDGRAGTITPANPSTQRLIADDSIKLADAVPAIGGDENAGTLAVLDAAQGRVWAMPIDPTQPLGSIAAVDPATAKPVATVGAKAALAVGLDGVVHTVSSAVGITNIKSKAVGWATDLQRLPSGLAGALSITAVGAQAVAMALVQGSDSPALILPDGSVKQLTHQAPGGVAVLQQPGPKDDDVLVGTSNAVLAVSLKTGDVRSVASGSGTPAAPVRFQRCTFAAWSGGAPTEARACGTDIAVKPLYSRTGAPITNLVFRQNHAQLLLNDRSSGQVWDDRSGSPVQIADWSAVQRPIESNKTDASDQFTTQDKLKAPQARDDQLGARPGRVTVLHVLDNDSTPARSVLTVNSVDAVGTDSARVSVAPDRQSVLVDLPASASGSFSFQYDDSNGGQKVSNKAHVTVNVVPLETTYPPLLRQGFKEPSWSVPVNGVVTIPVLNDWRVNEDGDQPALAALDAHSVTLPGASAIATSDGALVYQAGKDPGTDTLSFQVVDGDKVTPTSITLNVQAKDARAVAPIAENDYVRATVGQPITFSPLANDRPGSDPFTPDATLRVAGTIKGPNGLDVSAPDANGEVTITATKPGAYPPIPYQVSYGSVNSAPGFIRVDAVPVDSHANVQAGPDTVTVRGQAAALMDPLANDMSPAGSLLTVVGVHVADTEAANLEVAVVRGRWLRVNARQSVQTPTSETFTYTVTDGATTASAQVTVVEMPALLSDRPVAETDYANVRVGDSVVIPVLDNDVDPAGDALTLAQNTEGAPPGQLPVAATVPGQNVGTAYVSGGVVRYVAPAADAALTQEQEVRITYTAQNTTGGSDTGTVVVTVHPPGKAETDQAPIPQELEARVVAGGTITIPVPTSGVDPDGDTVQVQGLALPEDGDPQPRLGALIGYSSNSLTYQAYPSATNTGMDTLMYQVTDTYGLTARATVRIAVVQPTVLPPPVAHSFTVTAAPGTNLALDVVTPQHVDYPAGAEPTLLDPNQFVSDGKSIASLDHERSGWLNLAIPKDVPSGSMSVNYQVQGDLGEPSTGTITVNVIDGYVTPPVVVDEFAKPKVKASTVEVDLLAGDYSPTGGSLSVRERPGVTGNKLVVDLKSVPQVIPFVVQDSNGGTAAAVAYVPATGQNATPIWNGKTIKIPQAQPSTIDIAQYVSDLEGLPIKLTDRQKVWSSPTPGLASRITGVTQIELTGSQGFQGPASLTFAVTRTGDLNAYSLITVPVIVGDPAPVLRCPTDVVNVEAGLKSGSTMSPLTQCHVWTPPNVDPQSLRFHLSWQRQAALVSVSKNDAPQVGISADHNAKPNTTGVLAVSIVDYKSAASELNVKVVPAPKIRIAPISVQGILTTGQPTVINLASYVTSPFGFSAVSIIKVGSLENVAISNSATAITLKPTKKELHGQFQLSYTVTDLDTKSDSSRWKSGNIAVQFIGVPDAPTAVTPRPGFVSEAVPVSWVAPDDNGALIDEYEVSFTSAHGHTGKQSCKAVTQCDIVKLNNGDDYRFAVRAHNKAGWGVASALSGVGTPDKIPGVVSGFIATNPQDHTLTLKWDAINDGSSADGFSYLITWSGGVSGSAQVKDRSTTTLSVPDLVNDSVETFTIFAANRAGAQPVHTRTTGQSAGKPSPPDFTNNQFTPTKTAAGEAAVIITWTAVNDPNGPGPVTYTLTRSGKPTPVCAGTQDTQCTDTGLQTEGQTYTYTVTASNQVFTSDASAPTTVEVSTPPDQMAAPVLEQVKPSDPDGTVTVDFTTVPSNGKSLTVHCTYTANGSTPTTTSTTCPGSPWTGYTATGGSAATKTLSGLNPGRASMPIRVVMWEDNGSTQNTTYKNGPVSDVSNSVNTNAPPPEPNGSSCGLNGDNVVYNWNAVTGTNGRTISYDVTGDITTTVTATTVQVLHTEDYQSHSVSVTAVDSFGDRSSPALSINCPDKTPPPPPPVSGLSCSVNNTTITWTWTNPSPPNGNISYHWVLTDAINNSNYTSNTVSADFARGTGGHNLNVQTVDNGGQGSNTQSASCDSPPAPSITASKGNKVVVTTGNSVCKTSPGCTSIDFTVNNFPTGYYKWSCLENGVNYYNSTASVHVTSSTQTFNDSGDCVDNNTGVTVSIVLHNVYGADVRGDAQF